MQLYGESQIREICMPGLTRGKSHHAPPKLRFEGCLAVTLWTPWSLNEIGIPESSIVNLEYFDYARSKYLALGMEDTMPR